MADYNFNLTKNTWDQVANNQAAQEINSGNLNSNTIITTFDPIYGKLVEQISRTIYHKLSVTQLWGNLGTTNPTNSYPGMIREILMMQRKGKNFPMDNGARPTTLLNYNIHSDEIQTRYHSAQFRWMYEYTIFDEELRRFSGGSGTTIGQLTEMKQINSISARNMFVDNLRKKTMNVMSISAGTVFNVTSDIKDFANLTAEQAKQWLVDIDNLLFELRTGTAKYNSLKEFMQTPTARLQMAIPRAWYMNVLRRAFPDTYHTETFTGILPENLILLDTLGADQLLDSTGTPLSPTYNAEGMSLLNWQDGYTTEPEDNNLQAIIFDKGALCFEDNLNEVLVGQKDITKLATPVAAHYWTKAWFTDLLPVIRIELE